MWNNFLGMHPTFTQVLPTPHDWLWGEGTTKSAKPTFSLSYTAALLLAKPLNPPLISKRSKWYSKIIFIEMKY